MRIISQLIILVGTLITLMCLSQLSWVYLKAYAAKLLIAQAWQQSLVDGQPHRPWPWADTYPIATLSIGDETQFILANASMRNLAFGVNADSGQTPAQFDATIDTQRHPVNLFGHNDTHFKNVHLLDINDAIVIQTLSKHRRYVINHKAYIHEHALSLNETSQQGQIRLITCSLADKWRLVLSGTRLISVKQ